MCDHLHHIHKQFWWKNLYQHVGPEKETPIANFIIPYGSRYWLETVKGSPGDQWVWLMLG